MGLKLGNGAAAGGFRDLRYDFSLRDYRRGELALRMLSETSVPKPETIAQNLYSECGNVVACKRGSFSFAFKGGDTVELAANEILLVYPGNVVTIRALKGGSVLHYVAFEGTKVAEFMNGFGFYDRLRFSADIQDETFKSLLRSSEAGMRKEDVLAHVVDMLKTFQQGLRQMHGAALNDAVCVIHDNLSKGIVGLKAVCDVLGVSRSYLNGIFVKGGMDSPAAFIRREQIGMACRLLRTTTMPVVEIGQSVGIKSPVYFSSFIRRMTGRTPTEIRGQQ